MARRLLNIKVVTNVVVSLLIISGALISLSLPISLYYKSNDLSALTISSVITLLAGLLIKLSTRHHKDEEVKKRDG